MRVHVFVAIISLLTVCDSVTVSLTFIGGYSNQIQAANYLYNYGFNATFYITSWSITFIPNYMNVFDIQNLVQQNFEIGADGTSNIDTNDLTAIDQVRVVNRICSVRGQLMADGWSITSFLYPSNASSSYTTTVVKECGYNEAQIIDYGTTSISDPYHLGYKEVTSTTTLSDMTSIIGVNNTGWVIFAFSNVTFDNNSIFLQFLNWLIINRNNVAVKSINGVINGTYKSVPQPYNNMTPTPVPDKEAYVKMLVGCACLGAILLMIFYVAILTRCKGKCSKCSKCKCCGGCCGCCGRCCKRKKEKT